MAYNAAHSLGVLWAPESGSITESGDGTTPGTLPANPTPTGLVGWCNALDIRRGLNNSNGKAIGVLGNAYKKRGAQTPGGSFTLSGGGALAFLEYAVHSNGVLQEFALYVGRSGDYTYCFRKCKITQLVITLNESSDGEAQEVQIQVTFEAIALNVLEGGSALTFNLLTLRAALDQPLFWHDVREFAIEDSDGTSTDYRSAVMSASLTIAFTINRKSGRHNYGDNSPLSRTNYTILVTDLNVSGQIDFHGRLPNTYFTAAATSQNWGNISFVISDSPAPGANVQTLTVTAVNCTPNDETQNVGDASQQLSSSIPFTAFSYELVQEVEPVGGD